MPPETLHAAGLSVSFRSAANTPFSRNTADTVPKFFAEMLKTAALQILAMVNSFFLASFSRRLPVNALSAVVGFSLLSYGAFQFKALIAAMRSGLVVGFVEIVSFKASPRVDVFRSSVDSPFKSRV